MLVCRIQQVIRVVVLLGLTTACSLSQSRSDPRGQLALIIAPSAFSVHYASRAGETELTYTVQEPYPAEQTIRFIEKTLSSRNWKPLKSDAAANARTSHASEWTSYENATCLATRTIHQRVAEWEDEGHNQVRYTLRYVEKDTDSQDENAPAPLQVSAVYIPAGVARPMTHVSPL